MGLEDLTINGAVRISPEKKNSVFYALDDHTYLHVQEAGSGSVNARLCCNERTDKFFARLQDMTKQMSGFYGRDITIPVKEFSSEEKFDYKFSDNCRITIKPKRRVDYEDIALLAVIGPTIGGMFGMVPAIPALTADSALAAIPISIGIALGALPSIVYGLTTCSSKYNIKKLERIKERINYLETRLEAVPSTDVFGQVVSRSKRIQKRIFRLKEEATGIEKRLKEFNGGFNLEYNGSKEEVEAFLNYLLESKADETTLSRLKKVVQRMREREKEMKEDDAVQYKEAEDEKDYVSEESGIEKIVVPQRRIQDPLKARIGDIIDERYEVLECEGIGKNGVVYTARRLADDKLIALKFMNEEKIFQLMPVLMDFDHMNIIKILDANPNKSYIAMERMPFNLEELLQERRKQKQFGLPIDTAMNIFYQIANGLAYAHERIIHGDFNPRNVLLDELCRAKICDFGESQIIDKGIQSSLSMTLEHDKNIAGSLYYFAPEQIEDGITDKKSDVYALGKIVYKMLTGTADVRPVNISELRDDIPEEIEGILERMLSLDPEVRPNTAEIAEVLEKNNITKEAELKIVRESKQIPEITEPLVDPLRVSLSELEEDNKNISAYKSPSFIKTLTEVAHGSYGLQGYPRLVDASPEPEEPITLERIKEELNVIKHIARIEYNKEKKEAGIEIPSEELVEAGCADSAEEEDYYEEDDEEKGLVFA